ncbi:FAD-binding protein, partial [Lactococcus lactis]|uniref:FAD-binding protein n=2 Tax=Bacillati TaxID=1783272 RepID=UPI003EBB2084
FDTMPELVGSLDTDEDSLRWAARDYGDVVHHLPAAVLRPANAADIRTAVAFARQHGLRIVPRGQGHSTGGQAQALGGVVVDMNQLGAIHD